MGLLVTGSVGSFIGVHYSWDYLFEIIGILRRAANQYVLFTNPMCFEFSLNIFYMCWGVNKVQNGFIFINFERFLYGIKKTNMYLGKMRYVDTLSAHTIKSEWPYRQPPVLLLEHNLRMCFYPCIFTDSHLRGRLKVFVKILKKNCQIKPFKN